MSKNLRPQSTIHFYGTEWCGDCRRAKQFLDSNNITYIYHDIENEPEAIKTVEKINRGMRSIPTIIFPDNSVLVEPSNQELAKKLNLS